MSYNVDLPVYGTPSELETDRVSISDFNVKEKQARDTPRNPNSSDGSSLVGFSRRLWKDDMSGVEYLEFLSWIATHYPLDIDKSMTTDQKAAYIAGVVEYGSKVGLLWPEALGLVYLKEGRVSIKGDLAMNLILKSGVLLEFKKEAFGTMDGKDYGIKLTGKRVLDNGGFIEFQSEYSIGDAIKAGLYRPKADVGENEFWVLYPERMVYYRALGFMSRDYFSDVIHGAYIFEELVGGLSVQKSKAAEQQQKVTTKESGKVVERSRKKEEALSTDKDVEPESTGPIETRLSDDSPEKHASEPESFPDPEELEQQIGLGVDVDNQEAPIPEYVRAEVENLNRDKEVIAALPSVGQMADHILRIAPHLSLVIDQIPGRRTKQRISSIIDIFVEDPRQMPAFMISEYAMTGINYDLGVDLLGNRDSVGATESTETTKDEVNIVAMSGWLVDLDPETGMRDYDEIEKLYDRLADVHSSFMDVMNQGFVDDTSQSNDDYESFEDFLLSAPSPDVAKLIVSAGIALDVDFTKFAAP